MRPPDDVPTFVGQIELSQPTVAGVTEGRDAAGYSRARVLVRLHGEPLGFVEAPVRAGRVDSESVTASAWCALRSRIDAHLAADGIESPAVWPSDGLPGATACPRRPPPSGRPPISVVVCTRNRPDLLRRTLPSLRGLQYPAYEVVLVDNAPDDEQTLASFRELTHGDERFRYVQEPIPGLSRARNRGVEAAQLPHVAFTDDDARPDPLWLEAIARGFDRSPQVACVTGLVPAAVLDTAAERYFDRRVSWSSRLGPRLYGVQAPDGLPRLFPFEAGAFGTGANFAVRREALADLGGFDEALGAGSPSRGCEDLDLFVRVLRARLLLAYEPSAIVWHEHRSTDADLRAQMRDYGIALGAFLTKQLRDPGTRRLFVRYFLRGLSHLTRGWRRAGHGAPAGRSFALTEVGGLLAGPGAYARGRRGAPEPVGRAS